jgi:Fe-S-cluster containining protein
MNPNKPPVFDCRQCGECCRGFGGTYVTEADIRKIADFLGMKPADFRREHCAPSGSRYVLAQGPDEFCRFVRDKMCGIHPVKPRMCRNWPYLDAVLTDPGNWFAMARACPGMRTDVSEAEVVAAVRAEIDRRNRSEKGGEPPEPDAE